MKLVIEFFLLGGIIVGGIFWQVYLFKRDSERAHAPIRIIIPAILGGLILIGIIVYSLIAIYADNRSIYDWKDFGYYFLRCLVLFLSFLLKSTFGPIFTSIIVAMLVYFLFEYGEFRIWSFIRVFLDWIFSSFPKWMETLYITTLFLVATGGAIIESSEFFDFS